MEMRMSTKYRWGNTLFAAIALQVLLSSICVSSTRAQQNSVPQQEALEDARTSAYRSLAKMSFEAFEKGDYRTASTLAAILERTWDTGEEFGGENALLALNPALFSKIDRALDRFIDPLMDYEAKKPDPALVRNTYDLLLEALREADPIPRRIYGVDRTRLGAYRALAQAAFEALQKGDRPGAVRLARILVVTWGRAEEHGGEDSLIKKDPALFQQVDKAMNAYWKLLKDSVNVAPEMGAVQNAYNTYEENLRLADQIPASKN
jgi:hypothetical protein